MDIGKELRVIEVDDHDARSLEIEWPEPEKSTPQPIEVEAKEA